MRKILLLIVATFLMNKNVKATTVYASTFGYNTTDATVALQAAINSGNSTVIVDVQAADWNVGPLFIDSKNPLTLIFNPGVTVRALPGMFPNDHDCLLEIKNSQNIIVKGYGAKFIMNKTEYTTGEWRHAIAIQNSKNVTILGLLIKNSGGDGFYVGADYTGAIKYSENIAITNCVCDSSKRQGISITDAKGVTVKYCEFSNSNGANTACGSNVEPTNATDSMINIIFNRCRFINNQSSAMRVALGNLQGASKPVSVTYYRCYSVNNGDAEIKVTGRPTNGVSGFVNFYLCLIDSSQNAGAYLSKNESDFSVGFSECVFRNVAKSASATIQPFMSEVTSYTTNCGRHGGINFGNVLLTYNTAKPWFKSYNNAATSPGLGTLSGFIVVWNPLQNANPNFGSNATGISLKDSLLSFWPYITLTSYSNDSIAAEGETNQANFKIDRNNYQNIYFPMCGTYSITGGTAVNGLDYHRLVGFEIMSATRAYLKDSLVAIADGLIEPMESVTLTINPSWMFTMGPLPSVNLYIKATPKRDFVETDFVPLSYTIINYNSSSQQLEITSDLKIKSCLIYNTVGELVLNNAFENQMDVSRLKSGLYIVTLIDDKEQFIGSKKFVVNTN